jgi:solute carrier family 25 protein 16
MDSDKKSISFILKSLVAGGIAGCAAKTIVAPLDRVKILFQTNHIIYAPFQGSFSGYFKAISMVQNQQGIRGLFQGHSATLLRIFPYAGIKFMMYEQFKVYMMPTKVRETIDEIGTSNWKKKIHSRQFSWLYFRNLYLSLRSDTCAFGL